MLPVEIPHLKLVFIVSVAMTMYATFVLTVQQPETWTTKPCVVLIRPLIMSQPQGNGLTGEVDSGNH